MMLSLSTVLVLTLSLSAKGANIVLTNDDGWATAMIRAQYNALKAAGHSVSLLDPARRHLLTFLQVVLSAPADDESGTGSSSATPRPLTRPCEFNSCSSGSPAEGFNSSDS